MAAPAADSASRTASVSGRWVVTARRWPAAGAGDIPPHPPGAGGELVPPALVRVADDVEDDPVRVSHEESPRAPGLLRERVDDLVAAALRLRVGGVDVGYL